jgi:DNA polymerase-3 subunit beta
MRNMRFSVERDTLADAVAWAARTLPVRPTTPVLAGMLIDADEQVTLSSFDMEVAGRLSIDAKIVESGRVLVSGRLLAEICRALPPAPVEVVVDGPKVVLRCGGSRFTLQTMPIADYPALPELPPLAGTVGADVFSVAVWQVAIAASRDASMPILSGVRVDIDGNRLRLAGTDRYRIAVRELEWQPTRDDVKMLALVPARAVAAMAKTWNSAEVRLHLAGDGTDSVVGFECGTRRSMSRLLEDQQLDYLSRFPDEYSATADVPTGAFIDAVRRVALVAERTAPIRLSFADGEVILEAATGDEAHAIEVMPVGFEGEPIRIAFNAQYLLEGLSAVDSDTARLSFTTAAKAALLTGKAGAEGETPSYRYLLMPIRLT